MKIRLLNFWGSWIRYCLVGLSVLVAQACSITPTTVRDSAASLSKGEMQIDANYLPTFGVSVAYGVTDNIDVGIDIENVSNLWTKYSFAPDAQGSQWALNAGMFTTRVDSYIEDGQYDSHTRIDGVFIGTIYSYKLEGGSAFNLAYRYNALRYDAFNTGRQGGLTFTPDDSFLAADFGTTVNVSSNDLAGIGMVSASWAIHWKPHVHVQVGAACQLFHTSSNPGIESTHCTPVLGLSFFRR